MTRPLVVLLAVGLLLSATRAEADLMTLNFDDVSDLAQYAPLGVTFSANASLWSGRGGSVFDNPDGGPVSVPNALQFGNAGGVLGSIFFSSDINLVSIYALSGPGPDLLSAGTYIRAFDSSGVELGVANANSSLQFDLLTISSPGIRRLDVFSPVVGTEVWDNLTFGVQAVPEPSGLISAGLGLAGLAGYALRRRSESRASQGTVFPREP